MAETAAATAGRPAGAVTRKLGTEVMGEFMELFQGIAAAAQPTDAEAATPANLLTWVKSDRGQIFEKFSDLAVKAAKELANYQQPKIGSVQMAAPPPPPQTHRKKFTLNIFDGSGRPAPRHIELKVNKPKGGKQQPRVH